MVTDFFGALLQELASHLKIADLRPDSNSSCLIKLKEGVEIQLELDRSGQFLVLGSDLGQIPLGRYREGLFKEALKSNALPPPNPGILAYSRKTDHLVLYQNLSAQDLNGEKVFEQITPFIQKAKIWKEALMRGEIPVANQIATPQRSTGMFGLRP